MGSDKVYTLCYHLGPDKKIYLKGVDSLFTQDIADARIFPTKNAAYMVSEKLSSGSLRVNVSIDEIGRKELFCKRLAYKKKI